MTVLACACGMGFNVVADPLVGYFYKTYLLGVPQDIASALAKMACLWPAEAEVRFPAGQSVFALSLFLSVFHR